MSMDNIETEERTEPQLGRVEKPERRIGIGVIGCGDIALRQHIPAIVSEKGARLTALCDLDTARTEQLAAKYGVPFVTSHYAELLSQSNVEAVVVATPPWITPHVTLECLRAGKHVLCEKPMAVRMDIAERVAQVEKETGRKVQVGFTYRHNPLLKALRRWIGDGRLGAPLVYRIGVFDEIWDPDGEPEHYARIRATMERGSPSLHDGAHIADFLNYLTGSTFSGVESFGQKSREEFPSTNYDVSVIHFANGDMARVEIGWFYPKFPAGEFEIIGPDGIAIFDRAKQYVELRVGSTTERVTLEEDWTASCFREQLRQFLASIVRDEPCVPGTAEGMASLRLTKEIESKMRS